MGPVQQASEVVVDLLNHLGTGVTEQRLEFAQILLPDILMD